MVIVAIAFELLTPENAYLRPSNLVYIFGLSTVYMVLAMGEIAVLLLGELDLSIGAVALMAGPSPTSWSSSRAPTGRGGWRSSPAWSAAVSSEGSRAPWLRDSGSPRSS